MYASDYRRIARDNLQFKWGMSVLVGFLALILGGMSSGGTIRINLNLGEAEEYITTPWQALTVLLGGTASFMGIVKLILGGPISLGYSTFLLKQHDKQDAGVETLFCHFKRFTDGLCMYLLRILFITLWTLLLIIPGIIKTYSYAMAPYILAENPGMTASESLRASEDLMEGNRWRLFCLHFSFIGWELLATLTFGIGSLFVNPYRYAAEAAFYRNLQGQRTRNIPPYAENQTEWL